MASIPLFNSDNQTFQLFQTRLKSLLDPVISNRLSQGVLVSNVSLTVGTNVLNHKLGRLQQGWILVDSNLPAVIWRSAAFTTTTLTLTSSATAAITASFWMF